MPPDRSLDPETTLREVHDCARTSRANSKEPCARATNPEVYDTDDNIDVHDVNGPSDAAEVFELDEDEIEAEESRDIPSIPAHCDSDASLSHPHILPLSTASPINADYSGSEMYEGDEGLELQDILDDPQAPKLPSHPSEETVVPWIIINDRKVFKPTVVRMIIVPYWR